MPQRAGVEGGGVDVARRVSDRQHSQSPHRQGQWGLELLRLEMETSAFKVPPASPSQVNSSARGGVRFIASVLQQAGGTTNGRLSSPKRGCRSPSGSPPGMPAKDGELEENSYSPGEERTAAHSPSVFLLQSCLSARLTLCHQI